MKTDSNELTEKELTENTIELDLNALRKVEGQVDVDLDESLKAQEREQLDVGAWMYESTVTNLPAFESTVTDLQLEISRESENADDEPAWRVLEKRREAAELKSMIGDDFLDLLEDPVQ